MLTKVLFIYPLSCLIWQHPNYQKNFILYFFHIHSSGLICHSCIYSFRWQWAGVLSGVLLVEGHDGAATHAWGKLQDGDLSEPHGRPGPRQDEGRQPSVGGDGQQNLAAVLWSARVAARGATREIVQKRNQLYCVCFPDSQKKRAGSGSQSKLDLISSVVRSALGRHGKESGTVEVIALLLLRWS